MLAVTITAASADMAATFLKVDSDMRTTPLMCNCRRQRGCATVVDSDHIGNTGYVTYDNPALRGPMQVIAIEVIQELDSVLTITAPRVHPARLGAPSVRIKKRATLL